MEKRIEQRTEYCSTATIAERKKRRTCCCYLYLWRIEMQIGGRWEEEGEKWAGFKGIGRRMKVAEEITRTFAQIKKRVRNNIIFPTAKLSRFSINMPNFTHAARLLFYLIVLDYSSINRVSNSLTS